MSKYPKQLLEYRYMSSLLNDTDLIANLIKLKDYYKKDNKLFTKGEKTIFSNNLYLGQAIEIYREIILLSGENKGKNIGDIKLFYKIINHYLKVKEILNKKYLKKLEKKGKLRQILFGLSHKQFWYQKIDNTLTFHINYYLNFYSNTKLNSIIKDGTGLNIEELLFVGVLLYNLFDENFYVSLDLDKSLYKDESKKILNKYSINIYSLKRKLKKDFEKKSTLLSITDLENYGLIQIFDKPILKIGKYYTCIFPLLFINRVTTALYYMFINSKEISNNERGEVNEKFIYNLFLNLENKYIIILTENYKKNYKTLLSNPDIIVTHNNYKIFFECKTNSLSYDSIINGLNIKDRKKIKNNIIQIYSSIKSYISINKGEKYFGVDYCEKPLILPIISYIKSPYLGFGGYLEGIINEIIYESVISKELIEKYPIKFIENTDIIFFINILNDLGIEKLFEYIYSDEFLGYELEAILIKLVKSKKMTIKYEKDILNLLDKELVKYKT